MAIPNNRRRLAARLLLAFTTAALVSMTAYLCACYEYRSYHYFSFDQHGTRKVLELLREEIDRHRIRTGNLPAQLADLASVKAGKVSVDATGRPCDMWKRPIQYRIEAGGFSLISYGRDGQTGGRGLDADLYSGKEDPPNELPTLWQFTVDLDTWGMQLACLGAGALTFPLYLISSFGWQGKKSLTAVLFVNAVTAIFAILTAVVISALHLPSGH